MKFVCFSDYCGAREHLFVVSAIVEREDPDLLFYCGGSMKGDIRFQEYEAARRFHSKPDLDSPAIQEEIGRDAEHLRDFLLALADTQKTVYVVPGYHDAPESLYFKTVYNYANIYPNLRPIHEMIYREDLFMISGFGGDMSLSDDNRDLVLQYSRTWVEFALRRVEYFPGEKLLLFYSPPVCRLDKSGDEHCGILLINELIEKISPRLVLCGRATSGQGMVKLGSTVVVNPGPFFEGHYAVIDYPSMDIQFKNVKSILT